MSVKAKVGETERERENGERRERRIGIMRFPPSSLVDNPPSERMKEWGKGRREKEGDEEERTTAGKKRGGEAHRGDKRHRRGILSSHRLVRSPFNGDSRGAEGSQDLIGESDDLL